LKPGREGLLQGLFALLEEEILQYHLLAEELKKQSESLRRGSNDDLIESLQSLDLIASAIRKIHESVLSTAENLAALLDPRGEKKGLSPLLPHLSPDDRLRIESYQRTLERLRKWSGRINDRNRAFIQESLSCWKELISLLAMPPADSAIYLPKGIKSSPAPRPYSLNRKV